MNIDYCLRFWADAAARFRSTYGNTNEERAIAAYRLAGVATMKPLTAHPEILRIPFLDAWEQQNANEVLGRIRELFAEYGAEKHGDRDWSLGWHKLAWLLAELPICPIANPPERVQIVAWRAACERFATLCDWLGESLRNEKSLFTTFSWGQGMLRRPVVISVKPVTATERDNPAKLAKEPRITVNTRMKTLIQSDRYEVSGFTAKQWAAKLKCSQTAVKESKTWKALKRLRDTEKAERSLERNGKQRFGKSVGQHRRNDEDE